MSELKELLDPSVVEHLKALAEETPVIYTVDLDEFPTTTINGVEVDLRGDAMHDTECADCREPMQVEIAPKGVDLDMLTSKPRVAVCEECGKARLVGQRGTMVHHKPQVAKHQPRVSDGIDHPVEVRTVDLSKYSPAQLAERVGTAQDVMRDKLERALPAKVVAALADRTEAASVDQALMEADRDARKGQVLGAMTVNGKEVPALDLSEVTNMSLIAPAKVRSPYNKVLFARGQEIIGKDEATYRVLADLHQSFWDDREGAEPVLVAAFDPEAPALPAEVQVLVDFGFDVEQATKMVAAL